MPATTEVNPEFESDPAQAGFRLARDPGGNRDTIGRSLNAGIERDHSGRLGLRPMRHIRRGTRLRMDGATPHYPGRDIPRRSRSSAAIGHLHMTRALKSSVHAFTRFQRRFIDQG